MSSVSSLLVAVLSVSAMAAPAQPPLRVCADPNNLPFSNRAQQGFENKIVRLIAGDLKRPLLYVWAPQRRGFVRHTLLAHLCDVIVGVPAGFGPLQTTRAYYRSAYAFVSRRDRQLRIASFDDPRLRTLAIGIQITGDDYNNPPAAQALASRQIIENVRGYTVYGDYSRPEPQRDLVQAVADGDIDVGVLWGPTAGYFARRGRVAMDVRPIAAEHDGPGLQLAFDIAMGVRPEDTALRQALDAAIDRRRRALRQILMAFGVPLR